MPACRASAFAPSLSLPLYVCVCVKDPTARLDVDCRQRRRIQSDCSAEGTEVEEGVRRSASKVIVSRNATLLRRYERERDAIRDAILTCNQKLTQVSLIYRGEPTTKNGKKSKN